MPVCRSLVGFSEGNAAEGIPEGELLTLCWTPMDGVLDGRTEVEFPVGSTEGTVVGTILML